MLRQLLKKPFLRTAISGPFLLNQQRELHSRNKKAMELIAKGWSALKEVDRVIDYCELNDQRLIPLLRAAKENFELALEADNLNTHARYWLSKLHLKYHVPGACKAVGAALLVEAADMGDPDAQYELGCRLRVENEYVQSDQQAFYYLEKAIEQVPFYNKVDDGFTSSLKPYWTLVALVASRASEKGHGAAAVAYGSLLLRGVEMPESLAKKKRRKDADKLIKNPVEMARQQFEIAAKAGYDLGLRWLEKLEEEKEKLLLNNG